MQSAPNLADETIGFLPFRRPRIEALGGADIPTHMGAFWRGIGKLIARVRQGGPTSQPSSKVASLHAPQGGPADANHKALAQVQKMAIVGQMAAGIAHDFNNSLQVAMLALAAAEKRLAQNRPRESQALLRDAHASLARASALSRRLLGFGSPRQDHAKRIELNEALVGMQGLLRGALGSAVALSIVLDDCALNLVCDAHELENVVLNLAVNARDAMPSGGRLTLSSFRAELVDERAGLRPGRYVGLNVTDTGCGMDPDVAKLAFDAFFTTKPPGKGTGLGLAMVKNFVDDHRGQVDIASAPGRGTTVRIYLPALG